MARTALFTIIASFVFLCSVQALYWPLIPKPGTEIHWWQIEALAKLGYVIGAPVVLLVANSPLTGTSQVLLGWGLSITWAVAVYYVLCALAKVIGQRKVNAA